MTGSGLLQVVFLLAWTGVQDEKAPIPDAASRQEVQKEIRELFKAEYSSRDPRDRAKLADRLILEAEVTGNTPVQRYVLLTEADLRERSFRPPP